VATGAIRALQQGRDPPLLRLRWDKRGGAGADRFAKTYIFELLYPKLKTQAVFTVPTRAVRKYRSIAPFTD